VPASAADAVAMAEAALAYLTAADLASVPADTQAECLLGLARVEALHLVARSDAVTAFGGSRGFEADGQFSAGTWLRWQARVTRGASALAVSWSRRLGAHPAVRAALAARQVSVSWAQQICAWTDRLPEEVRGQADEILLAAAVDADLTVVGQLAERIAALTVPPDTDDGKDFNDRSLALDLTLGGAGRLVADLTPECAAAVMAVLEALGKKAGPEDIRSLPQRQHDALEEACRRLAGSSMLPDRAGQPTQVQLHTNLGQFLGQHSGPPAPAQEQAQAGAGAPDWLRRLNGGPDGPDGPVPGLSGPAAWAAGRATGDGRPGWILDPATAEAYAYDAQITTIVTGHVDRVAVALAVRTFLAAAQSPPRGPHDCAVDGCDPAQCTRDHPAGRPVPFTFDELMDLFLHQSIEVLSGPTGLAAHLRAAAGGPAACGVSLPLDVGAITHTIPPHLRRAVIARDRHCAFPGCHQPPRPARCTTSSPGHKAAPPAWATWCCCVPFTTSSPSTGGAGPWPSTTTAPPPPPAPTDSAPSTATAHPPKPPPYNQPPPPDPGSQPALTIT
jgi:hypothetical protein